MTPSRQDQPSPTPPDAVYNIGAVTRLTGIPTATLHAWERRYGFPASLAHTRGGHRLYSEKDVTLLRLVKSRIDQGISARHAVTAVQQLDPGASLPVPLSLNSTPASLPDLAAALLASDLERADRLFSAMLAFRSPEDLTLEVIGPAFNLIGEAWEQGRISVAVEHLASNYLRQRLLIWLVSAPPARPIPPVLLACPPGEFHEGGLLMLGVLLRRQGFPVAYLGQDVPIKDLADFVQQIHPSAIVLVATTEPIARALADQLSSPKFRALRNLGQAGRGFLAFAGRAFVLHPQLKTRLPGLYLGDTLQEGLAKLITLLAK